MFSCVLIHIAFYGKQLIPLTPSPLGERCVTPFYKGQDVWNVCELNIIYTKQTLSIPWSIPYANFTFSFTNKKSQRSKIYAS